MTDYFLGILAIWNIGLTLLFLFDKSRIDCAEKSIGSMVKQMCRDKEDENDWR